MEKTFDWQGNLVKEGDEVCLIRTKKLGIKNISMVLNEQDFGKHSLEEEDCWDIVRSNKVFKIGDMLSIFDNSYGITLLTPLHFLKRELDQHLILAIRGVSDMKPSDIVI